ncbi:MAG: hypothetical protein RLZ28_1151 [Actinomycetota bacterium]
MTNLSAELSQLAKERGRAKSVIIAGKRTAYWVYEAEAGQSSPGKTQASQVARAETIVMIHGYRGNHHGLEAIVGSLSDRNVIVPDLPGFGESEEFDEFHSIDRYARWVGDFLAALETSGQIKLAETALLGHSFGTIVVAAAVAEGLAKPASLILINPVSTPALSGPRSIMTKLTAFYYWMGSSLPVRAGNALLASPLIVRFMSALLAKTKDAELRRWIHREHDENFSNFSDRRVASEGFTASVSHNVGEYAAKITIPTLLIIGQKDDITSVADQHRVKEIFPNAQLNQIGGVGHLIHYEEPFLAAEIITEFLESTP